MMKSFRRSKRRSNSSATSPKHSISRIGSSNSDFESVLQSPKKVIKALYDYEPQGPGELKFEKGEFFHVLNDGENGEGENGWYEAINPMLGQRGMVPVSYFEVFGRKPVGVGLQSIPLLGNQEGIHVLPAGSKVGGGPNVTNASRNSNQTLYAVTLYEFKAERDDELDILPGENLIICAHHEYEWFIAKPINRLGGPGLVPVSYVKIIDLMNPSNSQAIDASHSSSDTIRVINSFKIPTVEQWKDQTAKYQASTISLGSISHSQAPPVSSNTQFFEGNATGSNRSSLSSSNTTILEAGVDSYQLDHGRYQYLVITRLSNGKVRYLYRYYQDFYDLQVKLLELFPYEAGKIENSKRIIPSIPGPLINVNDSISKLRREKLDYYLKNLIALPVHISRSEEVLKLFEVLDNGFDRESSDVKRALKPISQHSNYHHDRLSQYSNFHNQAATRTSGTPPSSESLTRTRSSSTTNILNNNGDVKISKVKVKFYFEEDIFVLLLPANLRLQDLKTKLYKRLNLNEQMGSQLNVQLFLKNDYDDFVNENEIANDDFSETHRMKLKEFEVDDDNKFHEILFDKCKLVILA